MDEEGRGWEPGHGGQPALVLVLLACLRRAPFVHSCPRIHPLALTCGWDKQGSSCCFEGARMNGGQAGTRTGLAEDHAPGREAHEGKRRVLRVVELEAWHWPAG